MSSLIKTLYQDLFISRTCMKQLDGPIRDCMSKLCSIYAETMSGKKREEINGAIVDMATEISEEAFVMGFRYATQLWTEALSNSEEEACGK